MTQYRFTGSVSEDAENISNWQYNHYNGELYEWLSAVTLPDWSIDSMDVQSNMQLTANRTLGSAAQILVNATLRVASGVTLTIDGTVSCYVPGIIVEGQIASRIGSVIVLAGTGHLSGITGSAIALAGTLNLDNCLVTPTGGGTPTYCPASDVRHGVDRGDGTTGTCYVPAAADVRHGTAVDATTGTCYVPGPDDVRATVHVDATTGNLIVPAPEIVEDEEHYGFHRINPERVVLVNAKSGTPDVSGELPYIGIESGHPKFMSEFLGQVSWDGSSRYMIRDATAAATWYGPDDGSLEGTYTAGSGATGTVALVYAAGQEVWEFTGTLVGTVLNPDDVREGVDCGGGQSGNLIVPAAADLSEYVHAGWHHTGEIETWEVTGTLVPATPPAAGTTVVHVISFAEQFQIRQAAVPTTDPTDKDHVYDGRVKTYVVEDTDPVTLTLVSGALYEWRGGDTGDWHQFTPTGEVYHVDSIISKTAAALGE